MLSWKNRLKKTRTGAKNVEGSFDVVVCLVEDRVDLLVGEAGKDAIDGGDVCLTLGVVLRVHGVDVSAGALDVPG